MTLFRKSADQEDGRQTSQNTILLGFGCPVVLWIRDVERWGSKVKRPFHILQMSPTVASLRQGEVLIFFYLPFTGGQGYEQRHFSLTVRQRGRILWNSPLCTLIITKTAKTRVKVKETVFNMESELTSPWKTWTLKKNKIWMIWDVIKH